MVRLGEGGLEQPSMAAPKLGFPEKFFPVASALRACKMPVPLLCSCHQHQPQFPSPAPWQVNTYWRCHRLKMQIQHLRHLGIKITHVTYSFLLFINHPIPLMDTCSHKAFWTEFTVSLVYPLPDFPFLVFLSWFSIPHFSFYIFFCCMFFLFRSKCF